MSRHPRLAFACTVAGAWLVALLVRLYGLQVLDHERFAARAVDQQQAVVELSAPRGTIRDARGRELAVSLEVDSIYADPRQLRAADGDPQTVAAELAELLALDRSAQSALADRLASDRGFVWVARKPDPPLAEAVAAADLPGVFRVAESRRYYPLRSLGAHVLGFVGIDDKGLGGIEAMYDRAVGGSTVRRVVVSDGKSGRALHPRLGFDVARSGDDLTLTLDAAVQFVLERELTAAVRASNAERGAGVVLDPETGAVLAMAGVPSFDPNHFGSYPESRWRNPVIADAYEPGSTFKLITLAAALDRGVADLDKVYDCEMGALRLHGVTIRDHRPFGLLTVRQVLAKSSNVGAMKLGLGAGNEALFGMMRTFGIGRRTGIDLPGESAGLLRNVDDWRPLTPAYMSFGQGLSATVLQMAVAFSAVANGGRRVRPYVVAAQGGAPVHHPRPERVLRGETVSKLRSALESVVLEGTATSAQVAGYRVAGKTGTAQKAVRGGGYAKNRYVASFIGFVPADDPALVIAILVDEPWPHYHGSQAAAPVFAAVAKQVLLYLGVPPRREMPTLWPGQQTVTARFDDAPRLFPPSAAVASRQVPPGTVPSLIALDKRRAIALAAGNELELRLHGAGFVVRQAPEPGTPLELAGPTLDLWLQPAALAVHEWEGP